MLRHFAGLLPLPGRPTVTTVYLPLAVQALFLAKVLVFGWQTRDLAWVGFTVSALLLAHVDAAHERRVWFTELDAAAAREARLLAMLAETSAELASANTDDLTGLLTRRFIYRHLDRAPAAPDLTVAFVDADGLKAINDRLGHAAGDELLAAIAARLHTACGPGDMLVRLGGDEFALASTRPPDAVTDALTAAMHAPAVIAGHPMPLRISIGIVVTAGGDAHTALGCAEAAMRTAKRSGSFIERYRANRDGIPVPRGVRPAIRLRDQPPEPGRRHLTGPRPT
jgi:diguanylate cyclase (GGDEF)-like protein